LREEAEEEYNQSEYYKPLDYKLVLLEEFELPQQQSRLDRKKQKRREDLRLHDLIDARIGSEDICPICLDTMDIDSGRTVTTKCCVTPYHSECLGKTFENQSGTLECPTCRDTESIIQIPFPPPLNTDLEAGEAYMDLSQDYGQQWNPLDFFNAE
jgi:hypothetical protein